LIRRLLQIILELQGA